LDCGDARVGFARLSHVGPREQVTPQVNFARMLKGAMLRIATNGPTMLGYPTRTAVAIFRGGDLPLRSAARIGFVIMAAAYLLTPVHAQTSDDSLQIYAVSIIKTPPFQNKFVGDGIYLGQGFVITAAHVVGHWPFFTHPRVLISGQDLPAKVIKEGSFEQIDLALLSVEEDRLPISLRLRRNPLCKTSPKIGTEVVDVVPGETARSQTISPMLIAPELRNRFDTLISTAQGSGSGLFDAERKCLLGIVSAKVPKYKLQMRNGQIVKTPNDFAGYFVPASQIANFIPSNFHF
jgi:hypothetical protein